ncbi:MAG: DUF2878 domain-containing protein [Methylococcales bacterium]
MVLKATNIIGFQLGWLACVLGGAHGWPWLGMLLSLPVLAWHFWHAQPAWQEVRLLLLVALSGGVLDQAMLSLTLVSYPAENWPDQILPAWMWMLWMLFASTLNVGLRWLRGHAIAAVLFGLAGGPLAYFGASRLGAIDLVGGLGTLSIISLAWGVLTPALIWLSIRLDGYSRLDSLDGGLSRV